MEFAHRETKSAGDKAHFEVLKPSSYSSQKLNTLGDDSESFTNFVGLKCLPNLMWFLSQKIVLE